MAAPTDSGIYEIVNLKNGKRYVGSAISLRRRRVDHFAQLRHGKHINRHLQASFKRHGEENFQFQVLERCEPQQLIAREQAAIDQLRPEYNICRRAGSTLGVKRTPEQCAALSARKKGTVISAETRKKLSEALRGRTFAPEHLAKIASSLAARRASGWRPSREAIEKGAAKRRGQKASEETRAKLSAARKGKRVLPEGYRHSPEARARMSAAQRANPSFKGRTHSEEARAKIRAKATGRKMSSEAIAKMSLAHRGKKLSAAHIEKLRNRIVSQETRSKLSAAFKGRAFSEGSRRRMSEAQKRKAPPTSETRAKMSASRTGERNGSAILDQITILHGDGRRLTDLPMRLRAVTGISPAGMAQLIHGKQKTAKGWRLVLAQEATL